MIFIAMNNPRGGEALWPQPSRSSGHTLWRMVNEATGWAQDEYLTKCERVNIQIGLERMTEKQMSERIIAVREIIGDRRAIIIGKVSSTLLDAPQEPFTWEGGLASMPHTAGVNLFYNDPINWSKAVQFLRGALL